MNTKTVFVGHPVAGDVAGNMKKVLEICREIHTAGIIPVAPYLVSLQYLKNDITEESELGICANLKCFCRNYLDELWLFGDRISHGMKLEIMAAREKGIPIIPKTEETYQDLKQLKMLTRPVRDWI